MGPPAGAVCNSTRLFCLPWQLSTAVPFSATFSAAFWLVSLRGLCLTVPASQCPFLCPIDCLHNSPEFTGYLCLPAAMCLAPAVHSPPPSRCVCVPVLGADFPSLRAYSSPSPFLTAAAVPFLLTHEGPVQMRFPRHHLPLRPVLSSWSRELISGVCVPSLTVHVTVLSPSWAPGSFIRNS